MTIKINFLTLEQEHEDGREERLVPLCFQAYYYERGNYINESMYSLHVHFEGHNRWSSFKGLTRDMLAVLLKELKDREVPEEGTFSEVILDS